MAIARTLPTRNADGSAVVTPSRSGPYLEAYALPLGGGNWAFADEGSYYVGNNATLATGIAGHAAPVVADTDTKALFSLFNGSTKNVVMDYLFTELTAAGTAGTGAAFAADFADPAFRTPDDVVGYLHAPVLASLPRIARGGLSA